MAGKRKSNALKGSKTADSEQVAVATAKTLSIPEILSIIFSFSETPELAMSACVCKSWSDRALDELWRDLDSIFPLLELLMDSELVRAAIWNGADLEVVSSALATADWPRFHSYAKRVQFFHFDNISSPSLESGLIGTICLHHPYGTSLLPRLKRLDWSTGWTALPMIPFLSADLMHLDLELFSTRASDAQIKETFSALRNHTLKLKTFRLDTKAFGAASEAALALWLEKMETLEMLELPPYYLSARILTAIRTFPGLRVIDAPVSETSYQYNDTGSLAAIPSGSFPNLVELTLPATPAAAQHLLFKSRTNFTGLTVLNLHAPKDIKANQILSFTQQLAGHCPMVTTINLAFFLSPEFRSQGASVLPIEVLESLYPCKNLYALRIGNPLPLKLSPADVDNMARAWPQIGHLCLCSEPDFSFYVSGQMGNSLSILSVFASYLPHLITLGLYFNGQDRVAFKGHLYPRYQFTQLLTLLVGLSPIPKTSTRDLGFYLASLCSEAVGVCYGHRAWRGETMPPNTAEREKAWQDVGESMAFAMRVKLAGQD